MPIRQPQPRRLSSTVESSNSTQTVTRKHRYNWTQADDELLKSLVDEHGTKWSLISRRMDLGIGVMNYRRRWEVLHSTNQGTWTLVEDKKLDNVISTMVNSEQPFGSRGWWVKAARLLDTKRSARDCYWRWNYALKKLRGVSDSPVRINGKNIMRWSEDENRRLANAVRALTDPGELGAIVDRVCDEEPWLLLNMNTSRNMPIGFWLHVAGVVGTRTAQQCRLRWLIKQNYFKLGDTSTRTFTSIGEIKQLARLIERHGRKWEYLSATYYPQLKPRYLMFVYNEWARVADMYKVDPQTIDPEKILVDYAPGKRMAFRPTGTDGMYNPNGALKLVKRRRAISPMLPFHLALMRVRSERHKYSDKDSTRVYHFIPKDDRASKELTTLYSSSSTIDRLVAAVSVHGKDWAAVGKELGIRPQICSNLFDAASKIIPAFKDIPPIDKSGDDVKCSPPVQQ